MSFHAISISLIQAGFFWHDFCSHAFKYFLIVRVVLKKRRQIETDRQIDRDKEREMGSERDRMKIEKETHA